MKRKQNEVTQVAQALKNFFEAVSFFFVLKTKELDSHLMMKYIQLNAETELSLSSATDDISSSVLIIIFF